MDDSVDSLLDSFCLCQLWLISHQLQNKCSYLDHDLRIFSLHGTFFDYITSNRDLEETLSQRFTTKFERRRNTCSASVIGTVVTVFLLCYAVEVYSSFCYFTSICPLDEHIYNVVRFLVIINSAANPVAYAFLKRDMRRELDLIISKRSFIKTRSRRSNERSSGIWPLTMHVKRQDELPRYRIKALNLYSVRNHWWPSDDFQIRK